MAQGGLQQSLARKEAQLAQLVRRQKMLHQKLRQAQAVHRAKAQYKARARTGGPRKTASAAAGLAGAMRARKNAKLAQPQRRQVALHQAKTQYHQARARTGWRDSIIGNPFPRGSRPRRPIPIGQRPPGVKGPAKRPRRFGPYASVGFPPKTRRPRY